MKKLLALLLAMFMLLTMVGCPADTNEPADTDPDTEDVSEDETDPPVKDPDDDGPNIDPPDWYGMLDYYNAEGNPETFTMMIRDDGDFYVEEFMVDLEAAGENKTVLQEATYERNSNVEEIMGVAFDFLPVKSADYKTKFFDDFQNGKNSFDMAGMQANLIGGMLNQGLLADWNDVEYVDFEKEWWLSSANQAEDLTINGHLWSITGDATNISIGKILVMYFNKNLIENYTGMKADQFYNQVVNAKTSAGTVGKWTIDYMLNLTKDIWDDKNGNQEPDSGDFFGINFYLATICDNYFAAFDIPLVSQNEDGSYVIDLSGERVQIAWNKLADMCYGSNNYCYLTSNKATSITFFGSQGSLFTHGGLEWITNFLANDLNFEFSVIPYPKYNEAQESYKTTLSDVFSMLVISAEEDNLARVGAVAEAMGYESYNTTTEAYYETLLKGRGTYDTQSKEMIDTIYHNYVSFDPGLIYGSALSYPNQILRSKVLNSRRGAKQWSSTWDKNKDTYQGKVDDLFNLDVE